MNCGWYDQSQIQKLSDAQDPIKRQVQSILVKRDWSELLWEPVVLPREIKEKREFLESHDIGKLGLLFPKIWGAYN